MGITEEHLERVAAKRHAVSDAGREAAVAKQHGRGKLTARERIAAILDPGSFRETGQLVEPMRDTELTSTLQAPADGVVTGTGTIDGRPVCIISDDFTVLGGSVGVVGGEKVENLLVRAEKHGLPVIWLQEGAGHRIQDGLDSRHFASAGPIFWHMSRLSGWVPIATAILGPGYAGPTNMAAFADFRIMRRGHAQLGIGGPALVRAATGEEIDTESLGGAAVQADGVEVLGERPLAEAQLGEAGERRVERAVDERGAGLLEQHSREHVALVHLDHPRRDELVLADGAAELAAGARVLQARLELRAHHPDGGREDERPLVQHRGVKDGRAATRALEHGVRRHPAALEIEAGEARAREAHLVHRRADGEPRRPALHHEAGHALLRDAREDDEDVRLGAVRDPELAAAQEVAVAVGLGLRRHRHRVRAGLGLARRVRADLLPGSELRQMFCFDAIAAVRRDGGERGAGVERHVKP